MLIHIITILVSLFVTSIVKAETYWASPSGGAASCADAMGQSDPGEYRDLSQGLNCLSSGDTLRLTPGEYGIINGDQIPSGTPGAYTKIIGAGMSGGSKILIPTDNHGISFYTPRAYIELADLEIDGQAGTGRNAINIDSASQRLRFIRVWGHSTNNAGFFAVQDASDLEMFNVEFSHVGVKGSCGYRPGEGYCHGLYFAASAVLVDGCSVHDNDGLGFQIYEQPQKNVIVRNCRIYNNLSWGIFTSENATNVAIYESTIYRNGVGIAFHVGETNIAENNVVVGNYFKDIECKAGQCSKNLTTDDILSMSP